MQSYASATYAAAFDGSRDPRGTGVYLEMLDRMRAELAERRHATFAALCRAQCAYGVALLPLCDAIGDLRRADGTVAPAPAVRAPLVFAGYDVEDETDATIGRRVGVSTWALTPFASARVVDEALLVLCAALQRCTLVVLGHWYALEPQVGVAEAVADATDAAALAEAGFMGAASTAAATASTTMATTTAAAAAAARTAAAVVGDANTASGARAIDERIAELDQIAPMVSGIIATLLYILAHDCVTTTTTPAAAGASFGAMATPASATAAAAAAAAAATALDDADGDDPGKHPDFDEDADDDGDDALHGGLSSASSAKRAAAAASAVAAAPPRQLLKATVLALALYAREVVPATRALCTLRRACARAWVGPASHRCSAGAGGADVRAALRATRAHWLAAAFGCIQLHTQASRPDAPVPLRTLFTSLAIWADSCRRAHFRAAAVHFAAFCHWPAAVWSRACALAANPDPGASAGAAIEPVVTPGVGDEFGGGGAFSTSMAEALALCPGSGGAGGAQAALPWFPDGVVTEANMDDPLIQYALRRREYLRVQGGLAPDPLFPFPSTILNAHMPVVYYATCRTPVVETRPVTRMVADARETSAALCKSVSRIATTLTVV